MIGRLVAFFLAFEKATTETRLLQNQREALGLSEAFQCGRPQDIMYIM